MPNDSSTGGFIVEKSAPPYPVQDAAFSAFLQSLLVGLSGLVADTGVRPQWVPKPAPIPEPSVDWMAFAFGTIPTELEPEEEQLDTGGMIQTTNEVIEVLVSAYGPNAEAYAKRVRAGVHVEQNRAGMYSAGVGLVRIGRLIRAPEKRNGLWYNRWDLTLTLSREERREYAQLHFLGAAGAVVADRGEDSPVQEFTAGEVFVPPEP